MVGPDRGRNLCRKGDIWVIVVLSGRGLEKNHVRQMPDVHILSMWVQSGKRRGVVERDIFDKNESEKSLL